MNIALLEDNPDLNEEISFQLIHMGHQITSFSNGSSYLEWVKHNNDHDVLLLDLGLPDIDGLKVAEEIKYIKPNVQIIMLTARSSVMDKVKGWNAGANIYLTKPIDIQELQAILENIQTKSSFAKQWLTPDLTLNCISLTLTSANENKVKLSFIEVKLLTLLNEAVSKPVSRNRLICEMGENPDIYDDRRLEAIISRLRMKFLNLGCDKSMIQAVRNKGYILTHSIKII